MRSQEQAARRAARGFVLVYCLLAAGIVAGGYFYYAHFSQHFRAKVEDDLTTIGDLKVREVEQFRRERLADGAFLLKNVSISALVRRFMDNPGDADAKRQLEAWLEKFREAGDYSAVRLLDTKAATRMSLPAGGPPVTAAVSEHIADILGSGQVTFEDFHRSASDQRVYLDLLVPIVDEQNAGRPLGAFYLRIDPSVHFYPMFARWPIPSATAESKLVRRDGNAVLYLSELKTRSGTLLRERVPLTDTARTAVMAVLGREGIVHGLDKPGNPVVGYVKPIPDSPWFVVLREEASEAYAPVQEQRWLTIDLVAALLIGLGAGFMAIWRGERLRFYRERVDAAEALRQSEDRYQRLFESSPYPAWVYDLETLAFLDVNRAAVAHYGYSRDAFLAMTLKDIRPAEDLAKLTENLTAPRQLAERIRCLAAPQEGRDGH